MRFDIDAMRWDQIDQPLVAAEFPAGVLHGHNASSFSTMMSRRKREILENRCCPVRDKQGFTRQDLFAANADEVRL
jgi:hypothetical protein